MARRRPDVETAFAVVRHDTGAASDVPMNLRVSVKKVVTDREYAESEARRLNALNGNKGACYFVLVTRLELGTPDEVGEAPIVKQVPAGSESRPFGAGVVG